MKVCNQLSEMIPTVRGIVALNIVMLVTETISIIVRFWSRAVTPNVTFWWDDWAALTTWVGCSVLLSFPSFG